MTNRSTANRALVSVARGLLAVLSIASAAGAQPVALPALGITTMPDAPDWIRPGDHARIALTRTLTPAEGRLAVLVGDTDWTGLAEASGTIVTLRPAGVAFAPGEHTLVVYTVDGAERWTEIGRATLRVLTERGFEKAVATPALEANINAKTVVDRRPGAPPEYRQTDRTASLRGGVTTTHVRGGWTTTTDARVVGVDTRDQALRYGTLAEQAPLVDLSSYQFGVSNDLMTLGVGHGAFGAHRLLLDNFRSRGLSGTVRFGPVLDVSVAAANGTAIVGYGNLLGVGEDDHRVVNATIGLELVPRRRGGLRLAATVMNGTVQPLTNANQSAVRDGEESRGIGLQVQASDPASRLLLDAGVARSRFVNPRDPAAPAGLRIVPVADTTRTARYVDASYALLRGATLGRSLATLTATLRHSRVDPLYRSVSLPIRSDVEQNAVDVSAGLGAITSQLTYDRSRDNLAEIASVLTTRTRQWLWTSALPLHALGGANTPAGAWPTISYTVNRTHQVADGLPIGGLFDSLSQVPDQISRNQSLGVAWQGSIWRGGYGWNQSFQDNRQLGRERADLVSAVHTVHAGVMASTVLDAGLEVAFEDTDQRETARTDVTRRVSASLMWRPATRTSISAILTRNRLEDRPRTSARRTTDVNVTLAHAVALRPGNPDRQQAQLFVRYTRQTATSFALGLPEVLGRPFWTLNSGLTLRIF